MNACNLLDTTAVNTPWFFCSIKSDVMSAEGTEAVGIVVQTISTPQSLFFFLFLFFLLRVFQSLGGAQLIYWDTKENLRAKWNAFLSPRTRVWNRFIQCTLVGPRPSFTFSRWLLSHEDQMKERRGGGKEKVFLWSTQMMQLLNRLKATLLCIVGLEVSCYLDH